MRRTGIPNEVWNALDVLGEGEAPSIVRQYVLGELKPRRSFPHPLHWLQNEVRMWRLERRFAKEAAFTLDWDPAGEKVAITLHGTVLRRRNLRLRLNRLTIAPLRIGTNWSGWSFDAPSDIQPTISICNLHLEPKELKQ